MSSTDQPAALSLAEFFKTGRRLSFKKNEIIVRGDDGPNGVYFIESGFVKIYSITRLGNENIRVILQAGELFPVIWAFRGRAKNIFYEALGDASVWRVSREDFLKYAQSSLAAAMAVTDNLVDLFATYSARIDNLEYDSASERVAYLLLLLGKRFGVAEGKNLIIPAPLNHQNIADLVNLARETASRIMSKLEQKKLVTLAGKKIIIHDFSELKRHFEVFDRHNPWNMK